jgi:hypothetical protein
MNNIDTQLFPLGSVVMTPAARDLTKELGLDPAQWLARHCTGDWGDLDEQDKQENELSVKEGFRILSAYKVGKGEKLWIITEADRSVTTILLPDEY